MSRRIPDEELDAIIHVLAEYPQGLGRAAMEKALSGHLPHLNRQTLQRRLKRLQKEKRITTEGESIALRYKFASLPIASATETGQKENYGMGIK